MQNPQLSSISNFIWSIADSVLRDHYIRSKYRDVILPMTVIRRLDAVLAPTKDEVLAENERLEKSGFPEAARAQLLTRVTGVSFYNTSRFTLGTLAASDNPQRLRDDFESYLNGYSANDRDINNATELIKQSLTGELTSESLERILESGKSVAAKSP